MKKAIILTGSKQYLVSEGDILNVELIRTDQKKINLDVLLLIDGEKTTVGKPKVDAVKVVAEIVEPDIQSEKVVSIRYKSKKRVRKIKGHRQHQTKIKIESIK